VTEHTNGTGAASWDPAFAHVQPGSRAIDRDMTLLIPTLGRDMIRDSFAAVLAGSRWPGHIVVVDQPGSERVAAWLGEIERLGIRTSHVRSQETGRARALNRGLLAVVTRFVAITDDDCLPAEAWLERLGAHLRAYPGRVVTGRVDATGDERVMTTVLSPESVVTRRPRLLFDRLSGGNLAVAMEVFARAGMFDDDPCVAYSEDGEWAYRVLRRGVEIAYAPDCAVSHVGWRTIEERLLQYERYALAHAAFFGKHIRRGDVFMVIRALANLVRALRRWLTGRLRGDAELAAHGRAYASRFLPGLLLGLRSRHRPPRLGDLPRNAQNAQMR